MLLFCVENMGLSITEGVNGKVCWLINSALGGESYEGF